MVRKPVAGSQPWPPTVVAGCVGMEGPDFLLRRCSASRGGLAVVSRVCQKQEEEAKRQLAAQGHATGAGPQK